MSNSKKNKKKNKIQKRTLKLCRRHSLFVRVRDARSYAYCVAFTGWWSCVSVCHLCGVVQVRGHRCWVRGRRRWSLLGAGWCVRVVLLCSVLCVLPLCFCTSISGRVGSGQPKTYRAKNKKKNRYSAFSAIPPCHRFSVVFFQISAMLFRHGRYLITLE